MQLLESPETEKWGAPVPLRAVTGPVFDSFFNVSFRMLSETYRAVLVDVSYLAVDALEGSLVKGDDRIARVWAHRAHLEKLASKKWDNGEYEDVAGMLHLRMPQISNLVTPCLLFASILSIRRQVSVL